jgi:hypothetical protein
MKNLKKNKALRRKIKKSQKKMRSKTKGRAKTILKSKEIRIFLFEVAC